MLSASILLATSLPGSLRLAVGAISTITDDTKYNAWPSVTRMANGNLLAAYVKANNHNADNSGTVVGRISTDSGGSWAAEVTLASDVTYGAINPAVASLASGRVLLTYNLFDYPNEFVDDVRVKYSDDYGATWSSAYTVDSGFTGWVANGGNPVQLGSGTIVLPVYGINTGNTYASARALFSTDDGATFGSEVTVANGQSDGRHYYEPALVRTADSSLLCLMRTTSLAGTVYKSTSTNGGSTWSAVSVAFGGYATPYAIRAANGMLVAVTRHNPNAAVVAFVSMDNGATWGVGTVIDASMYQSEYGAAVQLADGRLLIVYGSQPTSATTNSDIKQAYVSWTTA